MRSLDCKFSVLQDDAPEKKNKKINFIKNLYREVLVERKGAEKEVI